MAARTPAGGEDAGAREGRIARSWRLSKLTWQLVRTDPVMLALAVVAMVTTVGALAVVYHLTGVFPAHHHADRTRFVIATLILAYPLTFISVFFNTAIAAAASAALDGRRLSLRAALAVPLRRLGQIALWSGLASVVGILIEQIASRLPFVGGVAARLFGLSWSLASMFAVPILATEGCSAPACLSRSAKLFKKRWGEGIAGNVIILAWTVIAYAVLFAVFVVVVIAVRGTPAGLVTAVGVLAIGVVALLAASAVIRQAFAVVLYRYAVAGSAPAPFSDADLGAPFTRGLRLHGRVAGSARSSRPSRRGLILWVLAVLPSAALTALWEVHKHHYAAHRFSARAMAAVMVFVALAVVLRLVLEGLSRLLRRRR